MCVFFFNDTATTEIYTLSLHDALPIYLVPLLVRSVIDLALAGAVQGARRQRADIADHPLAVRRGDQIQRRSRLARPPLHDGDESTDAAGPILLGEAVDLRFDGRDDLVVQDALRVPGHVAEKIGRAHV